MEECGQRFWFAGNRRRSVERTQHLLLLSLSQDLLASTFSDEVDHDEEVSHTVHVAATLLDSNASSFNEEANIEEPSFSVSLEGDFYSCDTNDEKKVTYGAAIYIDDYPFTH